MQSIIVMDLLSTTRLLPADVGNIARKEMGIIMKRGETEKQLKSKSTSKASTLTIEQQIARKEKKIENLDKYINKKMKDKEKELNKKLNRM
jgi:ubiquinone biosynthesis protein UbiJ